VFEDTAMGIEAATAARGLILLRMRLTLLSSVLRPIDWTEFATAAVPACCEEYELPGGVESSESTAS
jgi:hypothetical protein